MHRPDFIFMLTRNDCTIPDALEQLDEVLAAGVKHIGFKDIGMPMDYLQQLTSLIRAAGATIYLEVVSLDEVSEMNSARAALSLNVDVLMGGTHPELILPIIKGSGMRYFPFCGKIIGHPSVLEGSIQDITESAKCIAAMEGVDGLDILAYRFDGDVPALIKSVCSAVSKPIYVAGSIDREERIRAVIEGGAAGFTVGTAALDGVFLAETSGLISQIGSINWCIENVCIPSA